MLPELTMVYESELPAYRASGLMNNLSAILLCQKLNTLSTFEILYCAPGPPPRRYPPADPKLYYSCRRERIRLLDVPPRTQTRIKYIYIQSW